MAGGRAAGGHAPGAQQRPSPTGSICTWLVGDADGNGYYSIGDAEYIVSHIFSHGPAPVPHPIGSGDVDGSGTISLGNAVAMINFLFAQGPEPGRGNTCADYQGPRRAGVSDSCRCFSAS